MEFKGTKWKKEIDVRDFILSNFTPYSGDNSFLAPATEATDKLWKSLSEKMKIERERNLKEFEKST